MNLSVGQEINDKIEMIEKKITELKTVADVTDIQFKGSPIKDPDKKNNDAIQIHRIAKPGEASLAIRGNENIARLSQKFVEELINELEAEKASLEQSLEQLV